MESGWPILGFLMATTALAVCSSDTNLQTQVVIAANIGHPAGPGNGTPGSDPIATATSSS